MKRNTLFPSGLDLKKISNSWVLQNPSRYLSFLLVFVMVIISGLTYLSVSYIENKTLSKFQNITSDFSFDWLSVKPNGTKVELSGNAPDQIEYLGVISMVNLNFDPNGIINNIRESQKSYAPKQSLDLQLYSKNDAVFIFGSFANLDQRLATLEQLQVNHPLKAINDFSTLKPDNAITDAGLAVKFGTGVLNEIQEGVVTISGQTVSVTSHTDSQDQIESLSNRLRNDKPNAVELELNLSYPIPLVNPYRFGIFLDGKNSRMEICHVEDVEGKDRIITRVNSIIPNKEFSCQIALGSPSSGWVDLIDQLLAQLANAENTHLRISDFSVIILTENEFSEKEVLALQELFDNSPGNEFSVQILSNTANSALLNPNYLRISKDLDNRIFVFGTIQNDSIKSLMLEIISAYFVLDEINDFTLIDEEADFLELDLFTKGVKSLALLDTGELVIPEKGIYLSGNVSSTEKQETLNRYLTAEFNQGDYVSTVEIDEDIILATLLTAEQCNNGIEDVLSGKKITFDSGSIEINKQTSGIISELAGVLLECSHLSWEIGGHTDSQGQEKMNLELSTKRAEAVLHALELEGVPSENFIAKGYGESLPIASNRTSVGREKNRRIVIQLLAKEQVN